MLPLEARVWPLTAALATDGQLVVGGNFAKDLAHTYGTPLFVVDEADVRARIHQCAQAFTFPDLECSVHYASKAFASADVFRWVIEGGLGIDVASGGELALALAAGVPADRIVLHGNNKSSVELETAINAGVSAIVVDSFDEIMRLQQIVRHQNNVIDVLVRLTLGVEAHTHEFISTAHEDQKFGLSVLTGAAEQAAVAVMGIPGLRLRGFHSHIGSQIFEATGFEAAAERALAFIAYMHQRHDFVTEELDLGGGLGIAYVPTDDPLPIPVMAQALHDIVIRESARHGIKVPKLSVEPGRAIIGPSTVTLYEVGTIKPIELDGGEQRVYVSVDGGMSDNIRTALYDAQYTARVASRDTIGAPMLSRVVGKHCESGDIVVRDIDLPSDIAPGDLLAVAATGAYHRSMASNYNMVLRPAVVSVLNGTSRVLIRRETEADLFALDEGLTR